MGRRRSRTNLEEALRSVNKATELLNSHNYQAAKSCMEDAMRLHPDLDHGLEMSILCEILYYGNKQFPNIGIDWYSLLHLHPSVTDQEVKSQAIQLLKHIALLSAKSISCLAVTLIQQAISVLCCQPQRHEFDNKRKNSGVVDFLVETEGTFGEDYLGWKPPTFRVDFSNQNLIKRTQSVRDAYTFPDIPISPVNRKPSPSPGLEPNTNVFDEMPQNPHFAPFENFSEQTREKMIEVFNDRFVSLCEDIRKLDDPQCYRMEDFTKRMSELEEMGYNLEKVRERLEKLEGIVKGGLLSRDAMKKYEAEIEERESTILELKAEVDMRNQKIGILKKAAAGICRDFVSAANSKWNSS